MKHVSRLLVLLCVYLLTAMAWNVIIPPYENLDEIEHFEVIRYIAQNGALPIHGAAEAEGYHARQEVSQPPLYHILGAIWVRGWHLSTAPPSVRPYPSSLISCGQSETPYNKAKWIHTPAEGFPWQGSLLTLHLLRLLSTLLQLATLIGAWAFATRVFPNGPIPWLTTAMIAFNPQFLLVASGVNNDNLITPLATWGLVVAFDLWDRGPTPARATMFGLLSGLAALSKLSGAGLLALGWLALLVRVMQGRTSLTELLKWGLWLSAPAVVILAPWLMRNLYLYGDPTALRPMLDIVGQRTAPINLWGDLLLTLRSYWGQLPCVFYPRAAYWPYYGLVIGGLIGLLRHWREFAPRQQLAMGLAAIWLMIIVLAWMRWDRITPAPGGRLWFPASSAVSLLTAAGWASWSRRGTRLWAAGLPLLSLLILWIGPLATYAPAATVPLETTVPNPTNLTFGELIALRGYQARIKPPSPTCALISDAACRPALEVTFYWQAIQPQSDPVLAVQLRSPAPQDTTLRLNYNHWPSHGNLPLSVWPTDRLIRDHYVLPLPPSDAPTQAWQLTLAYYDLPTGERLPVQVNGVAVGDAAGLTLLRVPDYRPSLPDWHNPYTPITFGDAITLRDAQVTVVSGTWRVSLVWESTASLPDDYTVFVHALGTEPAPLSTGDGPPMQGRFPTSLWQPGDRIYDEHTFSMPEGITPTRIAVGLYRPQDGTRLPAQRRELPLPDNAAIIWAGH